ncbi:MAG: hypothetical protein WDO24_23985 [Pseudomonadota bacterium]
MTLRAIKQNEVLALRRASSGHRLQAARVRGRRGADRRRWRHLRLPPQDRRSADPRFLLHADLPHHGDHRGAGSFWGVVVAGVVMSALPELLRFSDDLRMVLYGAILVAAVLVSPTASPVAAPRRSRG